MLLLLWFNDKWFYLHMLTSTTTKKMRQTLVFCIQQTGKEYESELKTYVTGNQT